MSMQRASYKLKQRLRRCAVLFLLLLDVASAHGLFLAFQDVDNGLFGDGAISRAAFVVKKTKHFAESVGAGRIPEKCTRAAHANEADLAELFEMVRKGGRRDVEFILNFASNHSGGVRGEKHTHNLQTGFGAEGGEALRRAGNEEWINLGHILIVAEAW